MLRCKKPLGVISGGHSYIYFFKGPFPKDYLNELTMTL